MGIDVRISVSVPSVLKSWVKEASAAPKNLAVAAEGWPRFSAGTGPAMAVAARVVRMEMIVNCIVLVQRN